MMYYPIIHSYISAIYRSKLEIKDTSVLLICLISILKLEVKDTPILRICLIFTPVPIYYILVSGGSRDFPKGGFHP
jgi:hypothetical protein